MNRRRTLFTLLALATALGPSSARGQPPKRKEPYRIGLVPVPGPSDREAFKGAMRELGWTPDVDLVLVSSGVPFGRDAAASVRRLLEQKPDLLLIANTGYVVEAYRQTRSVPIVMWASGYPVEAGVADSLARPGRNVTGLSIYAGTEVFGKLLQLLREVRPGLRRVAVLWSYVPPLHPVEEIEPCYRELREASAQLGLETWILEIAKGEQLQDAFAAVASTGTEALLLTSGASVFALRNEMLAFAAEKRLPTVADFHWHTELQPLLRYSPSTASLLRQAAVYVDRILRQGVRPGELPIQQPSKFELQVNLKTARAIGLAVPESILLRADKVMD